MASHTQWKNIRLGDVAKVISGFAFKSKDFQQEGIPIIKIKNIRVGSVDLSEIDHVDSSFLSLDTKYHVKGGDILISLTGSHLTQPNSVVGRVALYSSSLGHCLLNQRAGKIIITKPDICDKLFLFYSIYTEEKRREIALMALGAASQANVSPSQVESVEMKLPPLSIQRKTAAILSAYDRLIENNTRRIEILEEMARSIYREWFVKFRFPGHEQVQMVDSELGLIPEGWEAKKIKDVVELAYGKSLIAKNRIPGTVPVYGSAGIVGYHNEALAKGPGVIVGRKGNVGSVFWSDDDFFPIDTVFYVQTDVCFHYVYYNLQTQNFINNDAAVPGLNRNQAYSLPFLLPSENLLKQFQHFVDVIFKQTSNLRIKNINLRQTRDLLLPRLISGEIDVENLDINTGEIAA